MVSSAPPSCWPRTQSGRIGLSGFSRTGRCCGSGVRGADSWIYSLKKPGRRGTFKALSIAYIHPAAYQASGAETARPSDS